MRIVSAGALAPKGSRAKSRNIEGMCGIFSSIGIPPDPRRIDIVAHRGPDGRGWMEYDSLCGPVALGHRRLKIIDLSEGGFQPMPDPSGRYHLIYNGEIYNYIELRQELQDQGEIFKTSSDSEVLLRAFSCWGEACLSKLRGMFAFIIWDRQTQQLFAARDRYGIKPLYFVLTSQIAGLGSEIKQLLGLPCLSGRMNIPRVHDFLASGISDHTSETMFEGISQLRGGECITISAAGHSLEPRIRRWHYLDEASLMMNEQEASGQFRRRLEESVQLHLRSDVTVGSCLSGGLDSSAIVGLMSVSKDKGADVHTVSACYEDSSVNEKHFMDSVVSKTGAIPHFIFPRAEDVFAEARAITWHQDEPFGSTSIFAQWSVFKEAKKAGITVMLDGQGADEQLAGYHFAFPYYLGQLLRAGSFFAFFRVLKERKDLHGTGYINQLSRVFSTLIPASTAEYLRRKHRRITASDWLGSELLLKQGNPTSAMQIALQGLNLEHPSDLDGLCKVMVHASNLPMLLHWEDRNSMAHGIEARVPFLDPPLVAFSLGLGNNHKMESSETKRVLRLAMKGYVPEDVLSRTDKLGFTTPEQGWFRGTLREAVHDGVEATLARFPGLLNAQGVRDMRDSMLEGRRPLDHSLWRIISLGIWGECFDVAL
jgi:asparagine synthase (glutamine-hydrolysing)